MILQHRFGIQKSRVSRRCSCFGTVFFEKFGKHANLLSRGISDTLKSKHMYSVNSEIL